MSISKRKLEANRRNAQKSTGATSAAGKEVVSQNAVRHGLCGRFQVLADEDQAEYNGLLQRFNEAEQPADAVERELVAKMARHTWMSERAVRLQEAHFLYQPQTDEQKAISRQTVAVLKGLDIYLRYQAHHDRAYQRAAAELAKRRKDRALLQRGFESQKRAQAEEERREKRQNQRDEAHPYRVMTAKLRCDHQIARAMKANSTLEPPDIGQIAA